MNKLSEIAVVFEYNDVAEVLQHHSARPHPICWHPPCSHCNPICYHCNPITSFILFPKLPLELRLKVYRYTLPAERLVTISWFNGDNPRCAGPTELAAERKISSTPRSPALLFTCRELRREMLKSCVTVNSYSENLQKIPQIRYILPDTDILVLPRFFLASISMPVDGVTWDRPSFPWIDTEIFSNDKFQLKIKKLGIWWMHAYELLEPIPFDFLRHVEEIRVFVEHSEEDVREEWCEGWDEIGRWQPGYGLPEDPTNEQYRHRVHSEEYTRNLAPYNEWRFGNNPTWWFKTALLDLERKNKGWRAPRVRVGLFDPEKLP